MTIASGSQTRRARMSDRQYVLIHDPRGSLRDLWASDEPTFNGEDVLACLPYAKYNPIRDYPFAPGCRFRSERGLVYGVYISHGKLVFGKVNQ